MKVNEPLTPQLPPVTAPEATRPSSSSGSAASRTSPPASDAVRLSGDILLADEAVRLAANAGDVRPHTVHRARQLLDTGSVGGDLDRLADRIIDSLLDQ